jgi:3-hydroxyisobutyrate dehydrogenase/2-hydroxy-3-oxopropionate reductase
VIDSVAVVGLGRMGSAMARRIHGAGFSLVVWNRDSAKSEQLARETGAAVASSAAEAARQSPFLLSSLADDAALERVYLGREGIVAGIGPGSIAVDTSTVAPDTIRRIGQALDAAGAGFLDCPVSGSVSTVADGNLTIMAGGEDILLKRIEPVLQTISARIIHIGPRGTGVAAKLAVNSLVHGLNVALSEALVLAEKAGLDRETAYEVFVSGVGGAPFVKYKREAYENPDSTPVAFSLDLVEKDLELITALAHRVGAPMAQAEVGLEIVRRAVAAGMGERDLSAIAVLLRGDD